MPFCRNLNKKVKKIVSAVDNRLNMYTEIAVDIAGTIRKAIYNPAIDLATAIIPGNADDVLIFKVRDAVDRSINALTDIQEIVNEKDLNKKLQLFLNDIGNLKPDVQDSKVFKLASLILKFMDGYKMKQSEYDLITQAKVISLK